MMSEPPNRSSATFHEIYYGSDDGFPRQDPRDEVHDAAHVAGLYEIFSRYEKLHQQIDPVRRQKIHLVSVVGGLYGLNLIPIFRPREITFFDINPRQIVFFHMIRRVWTDSGSSGEFLEKLARADYPADSDDERRIRTDIAAKQNQTVENEPGSSRSFLSSWRYALDHFELTRELLNRVPVKTRTEGMQSQSFIDFVAGHENLWVYCSNIMLFSFFDLTFQHPQNAVMFATYFENTEILDLANEGDGPVTVRCRIPMSVTR